MTFPKAVTDSFMVKIKVTLNLSSSFFFASAIDSRTKTSSSPRSSSASSEKLNRKWAKNIPKKPGKIQKGQKHWRPKSFLRK